MEKGKLYVLTSSKRSFQIEIPVWRATKQSQQKQSRLVATVTEGVKGWLAWMYFNLPITAAASKRDASSLEISLNEEIRKLEGAG